MSNFQQQPPAAEKKRRRWVPWAAGAGAFLLGLLIGAAGGGTATPQAQAEPQPGATVTLPAPPPETVKVPGPVQTVKVTLPPPGPKAAITEDGRWLVGTEVKPGRYRSSNSPDCYWARLSNLEGEGIDGIIANGNGPNQTVTIKKSDKAFETRNCGEWKPV